MKKSEQLFHLIKSMNKAEKRHFNLFANAENNSKNYILLFNEIDNQTVYDEKLIRKKFENATFLKQLHVTKNYLSSQILKSLRVYHSQSSINTKLNNLLLDIEILFKKELFEQCLEVIKKAEKLADKFEKFTFLFEILNWKRKILLAQGRFYNSQVNFGQLVFLQKSFLKKLNNENEYWQLTSKLYDVFGADEKTRQKFMKSKYLQNLKLADSLQAKILYYHIHYTLDTTDNKIDKALNYVTDLITLLENHPKQISEDASSYIFFMRNKLSEALHWTNELLSGKISGVREDLKSYVRFLNLMIHFELGNTIVLKYAVDASRRFLKKKRNLYDFEKVLLKFFSKISLARKSEHKKLFTELNKNLFAKTNDIKKADVLDYIDFIGWIESKL